MSNISFADAYINYIIKEYIKYKNIDFEWENKRFMLGTDNILGDPYFKMPTPAMIAEPALSYHSSLDIPERIEKDVIYRNGVITGAYLFGLAAADIKDAEQLWEMTAEYINNVKTDNIFFRQEMLSAARESMINFCPEYAPDIINTGEACTPPDYTGERAYFVPVRTTAGCLTFKPRPGLADAPYQPAWNTQLNLPLFWADGKRNLWEIAVLSAEEMQAHDLESHWHWLNDYFTFLEDNGYLKNHQ
jgi:hypothetical protein